MTSITEPKDEAEVPIDGDIRENGGLFVMGEEADIPPPPPPPKPREAFGRRKKLQQLRKDGADATPVFNPDLTLHADLDVTAECTYWLRKGECWRGERCGCPHDPRLRAAAPVEAGPLRAPISRVRNRWRASIFRRWLLDTFGIEMLKAGSGVVDVAGGQGELSFELVNLNDVPCTILDPRQGWNAAKATKLLQAGQYHSSEAMMRHINVPLEECQRRGPLFPRHERMFLDPRLWEGDDETRTDAYEHFRQRAHRVVWQPRGLVTQAAPEASEEAVQDAAVNTTSFEYFVELLSSSSAVVGMHPDQAAGAIVQFAVAHKKPYALVPCCTFAKEFPKRRLESGQAVRSYDDLISWLRELDPSASLQHLDFEGRNAVLYNTFDAEVRK
eukprot:TRINITY_DN83888_c0_g1_i1.p1 TRINITY_DN83888_c0_g1~~TRINITY_DN83888_c0_g1_i1.p1  ORF type:complete len:386 (+),score=45.84 TRINITY_DN83888_c0_g1_i1:241-1398(+)